MIIFCTAYNNAQASQYDRIKIFGWSILLMPNTHKCRTEYKDFRQRAVVKIILVIGCEKLVKGFGF